MLGFTLTAQGAEDNIVVKNLANEQNIVVLDSAKKFLLLPVQEDAPEGKINIVVNNRLQLDQSINIRLARERVDYYVPLDLSDYIGKTVSIDITGMPSSSLCWKEMKLSDTFDTSNHETFRPLYHHTPAYGWMNDPNGMFYKDGVYHLYFQYNPYGSMWGNMTWGHSTSTDLTHWKYEGNAIVADAWGTVFSGSCVVDKDNTAGFGKDAVIAFYTSAKPSPWGDVQAQNLAYSLDNGNTFTKYEYNPILTSPERDFRDPKVVWYAPDKHWVMMLAVGQQIQIYSSRDLKNWTKESSFGEKYGAHGGVWECPDLIQVPVRGTDTKKWVLICNINPGGPFGGSATQYFVGDFDGKTFTCDSKPEMTKWMDYGKDHYATVTWSNAPEDRNIAIAWMSNWQYANVVPTMQYRSSNSIPRELELFKGKDGELYIACTPVKEIENIRSNSVKYDTFKVNTAESEKKLESPASEIDFTLAAAKGEKVNITLSNSDGEKTVMTYDTDAGTFSMDRSVSGITSFSTDFPCTTVAKTPEGKTLHLRIFTDRSSIEAFEGKGQFVMTNTVFPEKPYDTISFTSDKGKCKVRSLNVHTLK